MSGRHTADAAAADGRMPDGGLMTSAAAALPRPLPIEPATGPNAVEVVGLTVGVGRLTAHLLGLGLQFASPALQMVFLRPVGGAGCLRFGR